MTENMAFYFNKDLNEFKKMVQDKKTKNNKEKASIRKKATETRVLGKRN